MSEYKFQSKATQQFGVTFRSKLEASWAYAINELKDVKWDYVDCNWHDFVIHAPWGDAFIEIKPAGPKFWTEAVLRIPVGQTLFILQGEPGQDRGDWWIETLVPVSCVHRKHRSSFGSVSWRSFEIQWLEAMWHGSRSFPITHATHFGLAELEGMDGKRDAMIEELRAAIATVEPQVSSFDDWNNRD